MNTYNDAQRMTTNFKIACQMTARNWNFAPFIQLLFGVPGEHGLVAVPLVEEGDGAEWGPVWMELPALERAKNMKTATCKLAQIVRTPTHVLTMLW